MKVVITEMRKILCAALAAMLLISLPMQAFADDRLLPPENEQSIETTDEEKQETAEPQTPESILFSAAELSPVQAQSPQLAVLVDELVAEVTDDEMDTSEKVRACYDYLVDNTSYGSHMSRLNTAVGDTTCRQIYSAYGEVEGFGAVALSAQKGLCNAYASAFILMTRSIGLDARLARGSTRRAGGGYTYHEWAEIEIDGTAYVFDPQLEQDLVQSGLAPYSVFAKTYGQLGGRYKLK